MDIEAIEAVLNRMDQEDTNQRLEGVEREKRWRSVPKETGMLLYQLVMTHRPQKVVEIGMSHGYSTLWIGLALKTYGGKLWSYEVEEWRYNQAVENIREAGLDDTISPNLVSPDNSSYPEDIDLVFIDAEKSDYISHFSNVKNRLRVNGIILADNTESHKDDLQEYVEMVRSDPDFLSLGLPVGKGIEFTRKLDKQEIKW